MGFCLLVWSFVCLGFFFFVFWVVFVCLPYFFVSPCRWLFRELGSLKKNSEENYWDDAWNNR